MISAPSGAASSWIAALAVTMGSIEAVASLHGPVQDGAAGATTAAVAPPVMLSNSTIVDGPLPTVSPTWGGQVAFAGADLVVTGPERVQQAGIEGQIMTAISGGGGVWVPLREYASMPGVRPGSVMLQHVAAQGEWFAANVERSDQTGEVMLLKRDAAASGWARFATLTSPPDRPDPLFGSAISMGGGTLAIGTTDSAIRNAPRRLVPDPRVHVFAARDGVWAREASLTPPVDASQSVWFGVQVAACGDRVIVSSPQAFTPNPKQPVDLGGTPSRIYVYRRGIDPSAPAGWGLEATLAAPAGTDNAFGISIASDGQVLAVRSTSVKAGQVGAQRDTETTIYVFRRSDDGGSSSWACEGVLQPGPGVAPGRGIGFSMAVSEGLVAVGDSAADLGTGTLGAVYVFGRDGGAWREAYRLAPNAPCATGRFGVSVAMSGRTVAVGRVRSERDDIEPGGVFVYQLP